LIRWFADLPIERKLRLVVLVPTMGVFAVAMIAHFAINLLHLRDDLEWSAARVARITGAGTIEALRLGDEKAALRAMSALRDEWLVSDADLLAANGRTLATFRRGHREAQLESAAAQNAVAIPREAPAIDPNNPPLYFQAGQFHIIAPVVRDQQILGYIHILVPLEVMYSGWPGYLFMTLAAIAAAVLTAYWLAARLQEQISAPIVNLAQTMLKMKSARSSTASIKCWDRSGIATRDSRSTVSSSSNKSRSARSIWETPTWS
jgi:hypothetical protein